MGAGQAPTRWYPFELSLASRIPSCSQIGSALLSLKSTPTPAAGRLGGDRVEVGVGFLSDNLAAIVLVLAGLGLVALYVLQSLQVNKLRRRIEQLTGGVEDGDLETVLGQHLETVHQVGRDLDELTERLAVLEIAARHHFSRQALIRFNPFPDTGGNQSFAWALLDESDDGVIVSSLHSRTGTRMYAKAVTGGRADTSLSTEEQDAIDEARSRRPARPATPPRSAAASRMAPAAGAVPAPVVPSPAALPVPGPAAGAVPAPAGEPAPVAGAAPSPAATPAAPVAESAAVESTHEISDRAATEQAKGQEKSTDSGAPDPEDAPDSERVGYKLGRPPESEAREK